VGYVLVLSPFGQRCLVLGCGLILPLSFLPVTLFFGNPAPNAFFSRPGWAEITFEIRINFGTSEFYFGGRIPRVGLQKLVGWHQ
jgi:hypothetical protein